MPKPSPYKEKSLRRPFPHSLALAELQGNASKRRRIASRDSSGSGRLFRGDDRMLREYPFWGTYLVSPNNLYHFEVLRTERFVIFWDANRRTIVPFWNTTDWMICTLLRCCSPNDLYPFEILLIEKLYPSEVLLNNQFVPFRCTNHRPICALLNYYSRTDLYHFVEVLIIERYVPFWSATDEIICTLLRFYAPSDLFPSEVLIT